jgi:LysM repeat protein
MMHFLRVFAVLGVLGLAALPAVAQDTAGLTEELRELRKTVDQQSKQIEMLIREVARLGAAVEGKSTAAAPSAPTAAAGTEEKPAAAPAPGAAPSEDFSANPPPKAEPARPRHIVVKGDTLTSIAKQYNITIAELQKSNKDVNERKLQIGQSLNLPPNAQNKAPAATPEPKPNP